MSWGDKGGWQGGGDGPWGKPRGNGPSNNNRPPEGDPVDFDEWLNAMQDKFRKLFGGGAAGGNNNKGFIVLLLGVALLWLASGLYVVESGEQGVVMRFGAYHHTAEPGLRYHLPAPIETVFTPSVEAINRIEIGSRSLGSNREAKYIPEESLMLAGDENIVDINFQVQWKIREADQFLFNVRNPEETVKSIAESAMREIIGKTPIASALAQGKEQIGVATRQLIQDTLDQYKAGIEIISVNILKVDPPAAVIDAFRDVQAATADQERSRNEAEAYRNDIIPRARGQAVQMLQEAEAYKQQVVAHAEGEAQRFLSIYKEYTVAPDVTRKRMYLETMEEILTGMNKLIMDNKSGGVVPYLPLPELTKPKAAEKQ